MASHKEYLGDSVYASFDGWMVTLTTENGYGASNTIHLEPEVYVALNRFVESLKQPVTAGPTEDDTDDDEGDEGGDET